jgi:transmembrane sensor
MDWAATVGATADVLRAMEDRLARRRQQRRRVLGGAGLALLLAGVWGYVPAERGATGAGRPSSVVVNAPATRLLADGSVVELGPGATLQEFFTADLRRIVLTDGEAHFAVARNPGRPFVVAVGGIEVRAVGTAFAVQVRREAVAVVVTEGRVTINRSPAASGGPAPEAAAPLAALEAGRSAVVDVAGGVRPPTAAVASLSAAEMADRLAWRVPTIEFSGTPLAEALPMINRHVPVPLVLGDRALRQIRLSGVLRADNVETLLLLLEEEHGVRATRRGDTAIVLSPGR